MKRKSDLRAYQERVATQLYEFDNRLVAIRMGGGKTAAALTAIRELIDNGVIRHCLVIAPKRVAALTWPSEIAEWEHLFGLRYQVLSGTPQQRLHMLLESPNYDVTLCGINLLPWLMAEIDTTPPDHPLMDMLLIDEVSKLRDPTGSWSKSMAKRSHRWKMVHGMSGTLRPSSAMDLFMPSKIVLRQESPWQGSFYKWRDQHFKTTDWSGFKWAPMPGMDEKLNAELAPLVITLDDNELPQLPELNIIFDEVELPPHARARYHAMENTLVSGNVFAANAGVMTGKLGQIANGFAYLPGGEVERIHDEKTEWLREMTDAATAPTMIVYEYKEDLDVIQDLLGDRVTLLGGSDDKTAAATLDAWNRKEIPFLTLHPGAAGHGINAQHGGSDQLWMSPCWSPELWAQTIARLHRSGQTQPVFIRVCKARFTVDKMKIDRVHFKMTAEAAFEAYLREHHYGGEKRGASRSGKR
jgi:hypothetical protein